MKKAKLLKIIISLLLSTLYFGSAAAAQTTVSGTVSGNDGKTVKGAVVEVGIPPDITLSATTIEKGEFSITVPATISIPSSGQSVGISARFRGDSTGTLSATIGANQDNKFDTLLRLDRTPGNSDPPPGGAEGGSGGERTSVKTEFGTFSNVGEYLGAVIKWAARLGVVAAVLMIVFGGLRIVTSGGNTEVVGQAKEIIEGALLGLAVIFLIGVFLSALVDLGQFSR